MPPDKLIQLASLITFTFGALTFSVLTLFYWRNRDSQRSRSSGVVFPAFTLACATAFVMNLLILAAQNNDSAPATFFLVASAVIAALLPPLLLHLIYQEERNQLPAASFWRFSLLLFYVISGSMALVQGLDDNELIHTGLSDQLQKVPALTLAVAGALGLVLQILSLRQLSPVERRHRSWNRALLALTLITAVANLFIPFVSFLADYLVLAFFCVTLYYKERLVFFDLLIKRGAFFGLALVTLTSFFLLAPADRFPADWSRPWIIALLLMPLFLLAPWIYGRLSGAIDRVWLRRRYSPAEAERHFVRCVQPALTEDDLRSRAAASLSDIFQTAAQVCFSAAPHPIIESDLATPLDPTGWILLPARPNQIPFLSDDHRLLQSLARTLSVVLENVRFREQHQQLRLLASRAELKALRAQINPHFLFNALNAIAGLIPTQPQLADETVERLAEVFRYTLRKSENGWVRLDEEIEFLRAYLRIEQARFGHRLKVEIEIDPAAAAITVPAMVVQPLIENAIKHGLPDHAGLVALHVNLEGDQLIIEVVDNGPGFPPGFSVNANGDSHGLHNIAGRLKGYYGNAAQLTWQNTASGTRVRLNIPHRDSPVKNDTHADRR